MEHRIQRLQSYSELPQTSSLDTILKTIFEATKPDYTLSRSAQKVLSNQYPDLSALYNLTSEHTSRSLIISRIPQLLNLVSTQGLILKSYSGIELKGDDAGVLEEASFLLRDLTRGGFKRLRFGLVRYFPDGQVNQVSLDEQISRGVSISRRNPFYIARRVKHFSAAVEYDHPSSLFLEE